MTDTPEGETLPPPDDATSRQITASRPDRSTWLTANAGSGKTRVLTDRVARLLLSGTRPERVLCLTYTKAAATEMQNRLLKRLGEWAMLPDDRLIAALRDLGVTDAPDLPAARRLFAQAIETPGGLKVQTIHSFCASLLRRFPLEAGVPHGFTELDERSAKLLRQRVLEDMADEGVAEIGDITSIHSGDMLDGLLAQLAGGLDQMGGEQALRDAAGVPEGFTEGDLLAQVFTGDEAVWMAELIPLIARGSTNDVKLAAKLRQVDWAAPGLVGLEILEGALLTGSGAAMPYTAKIDGLPTKKLREGVCAVYMDQLNDLMERVEAARAQRIALKFVQRSAALLRFGTEFSRRYQAQKSDAGWLDFDDLITRTATLLSDAAMAQWVLFRLDGGIDHILVDEAQDTSPEQWCVVERLTAEFTAGELDRVRTLFVVGDPKQSIYSFQGADIAVFEDRQKEFDRDFAAVQRPMQQLDLEYSFRSSPAILRAVDATFAGEAGRGLGQDSHHRAFLADRPGRVDLWPPVEPPEKTEDLPWEEPVDQLAPDAAPTQLAEEIARQISAMLDPVSGASITTREGIRRLDAGDILILVQGRRSPLFSEIIRALKAAELPVAGADRLKLAAELAVRDIRAMLNFLATPEDDLSLAALLRSPLIGLDEDALFRLAHGREKREYLWRRLRDSDHAEAQELLSDMLRHTSLRPFDLISRLLNRHSGRERLLARLGPEAEDGIDELLTQALAYERSEVPSLTGFLVWLSADDVEIRRQPGSGEGLIRVMTVHGSKGLESPVVILPDTKKRNAYRPPEVLRRGDAPPLLTGTTVERPDFAQDAVSEAAQRDAEERKRLLYVAMTRAESWLIVASAGDPGAGEESWYAMMRDGLAASGLEETQLEGGLGPVTRYSFGDWPDAPAAERQPKPPAPDAPWLWTAPPEAAPRKLPLSASGLGGAKALPGPDGNDPEAAMLFGTRLHLLLENLPDIAHSEWHDRARDMLSGSEGGLPDAEMLQTLIEEARAVIEAPPLAGLFDIPGDETVMTEVELAFSLPGRGPVRGIVDRLIVGPDRVSLIDYKSNMTVPDRPEATPQGILRQMAAYRSALSRIYPGRMLRTGILWTSRREVMWLRDEILDRVAASLDPAGPAA
ncbi:double-strand break repair helicase AddA [Paracoccus aerodenitrificans]|uniref:double-strand break repair helicase AddA n=1 Tax=Paracoccus aerodenitrificans TaxID=3017781 RepID=UPI0022F06AFB|nr:double-strand break repair helicase AddA [Paracoccus aerodenitrificans]WBU63817.1 double-strand break repair helicase AddA [Paracoccus aerodenitrificans]